jgi:hypothetical protein
MIIPSTLSYNDSEKMIPIIKRYLKKFDNSNFEIELGDKNWIINDPLQRYNTDFSRYMVRNLYRLNALPGYTLVGDDPIDSFIYSQLDKETIVFDGLLLSKEKIDIKGKKKDLITKNYKYIRNLSMNQIDKYKLKKEWKMTEIYNTNMGLVFVSTFDEMVDFQLLYQKFIRNNLE